VFADDDGAIAAAEAEAKRDPTKRIDLLKLLQVGCGRSGKLHVIRLRWWGVGEWDGLLTC
jgi:hypothetical protein